MDAGEQVVKLITNLILVHYSHFFPSSYPDIPLNMSMITDVSTKASVDISAFGNEDLLKQVELRLSKTAPLNWSNYGSIALLLRNLYPEEDLLSVREQSIIDYVRGLPNFDDSNPPDHDSIDSIIYTWMSLEEDDY